MLHPRVGLLSLSLTLNPNPNPNPNPNEGIHQHDRRFTMESFVRRMGEYACSRAYRMPWLRLDSVGPGARRSDGAVLTQL